MKKKKKNFNQRSIPNHCHNFHSRFQESHQLACCYSLSLETLPKLIQNSLKFRKRFQLFFKN